MSGVIIKSSVDIETSLFTDEEVKSLVNSQFGATVGGIIQVLYGCTVEDSFTETFKLMKIFPDLNLILVGVECVDSYHSEYTFRWHVLLDEYTIMFSVNKQIIEGVTNVVSLYKYGPKKLYTLECELMKLVY